MALPSIASIFGWELIATNVTFTEEEETHNNLLVLNEKIPVKTLDVNDFLKFRELIIIENSYDVSDHSAHLSPFITIFSPPPEV